MNRRNWVFSLLSVAVGALGAFAQKPRAAVAPGLRIKKGLGLKRTGVALEEAVARITFLAFSRPDKSMRVEVSVWATRDAYDAWESGETAGNEPIQVESLSATGPQYDAVLTQYPQLFTGLIAGAEALVLADPRLKGIFESAR